MSELERWKLLGSETIVSSRWVNVYRNRYADGDREVTDYFVLRRSDFVVVVAIDEADHVHLVRQYRAATDEFYVALPAGYIGDGETPEEAARRELLEEAGVEGRNWRYVGRLDPLPGYIESRAHVLRCDVPGSDPARATDRGDDDETVQTLLLPRAEVRRRIVAGEMIEMQAVAAFLLAEAGETD